MEEEEEEAVEVEVVLHQQVGPVQGPQLGALALFHVTLVASSHCGTKMSTLMELILTITFEDRDRITYLMGTWIVGPRRLNMVRLNPRSRKI